MAPTDDMTQDPTAAQPNFWDTWGKPIGTGAGIGAGAYFGKRTQDAAAQRSPEEQAAITGAMGPGGARDVAQSLMQESRPYISKPASYYQTLLNGNRAAMAQAVAPQRAALNEGYRGAATNITRSGARGAVRDQLTGDLNRQKAGQVAGLTTGVQPQAAAALGSLGQDLQAKAVPLYGQATNFYGQLLDSGLRNRAYAAGQGQDTAAQIGRLTADIGNTNFGRGPKKKPAAPGATGSDVGSSTTVPAPPGYYDVGPMQPQLVPEFGPVNPGMLPGGVGTPPPPPSYGDLGDHRGSYDDPY